MLPSGRLNAQLKVFPSRFRRRTAPASLCRDTDVGGLRVGKVLQKLEDAYEGQAPWSQRGLPCVRK